MSEPSDYMTMASWRVIQLGQVIDGQPTKNPGVPDFEMSLYERHQFGHEIIPGQIEGVTSATETITMSTHSGTHMDSLSHIGLDGILFDGSRIDDLEVQDPVRGVRLRTRENFSPIASRGILLDFAAMLGVDRVPQDYVIRMPEFREACEAYGVTIQNGDTVLFRTGWDTLLDDNDAYVAMPIPGPELDVVEHLVAAGVVAVGSDTMPFEAAPGDETLAVHVYLIPRSGVFIFEMMDLRELAASGVQEFVFVAAPLRLRWGTGSPVNPLAILAP